VVRLLGIAPPLSGQIGGLVRDQWIPFKHSPNSVARGRSESDEFDFEYRHNSIGFRDVEHQTDKPPGVIRVVALGDSFTYGEGAAFEETWPSRLESLLRQRLGDSARVEVIQLGLRRYYPAAERLVLEHYGLRFKPDVVVLAIVPNDVIDTRLGLDAIYVDGSGYLRNSSAAPFGQVGGWLFLHSHAMRIVLRVASAAIQNAETSVVWDDIYRSGGAHEADWRAMEGDIGAIADLARQHGAGFILASLPMQGPWTKDSPYPDLRLKGWAETRAVPYVGLFDAFRSGTERGQTLFWSRNGHPTPAGYALIAEQLAPVVLQALPPATPLR
jgi:lysophospholipase L1-like esterase